jgi:hypothetical protein
MESANPRRSASKYKQASTSSLRDERLIDERKVDVVAVSAKSVAPSTYSCTIDPTLTCTVSQKVVMLARVEPQPLLKHRCTFDQKLKGVILCKKLYYL